MAKLSWEHAQRRTVELSRCLKMSAVVSLTQLKPEKNSGLNRIRTHDLCDTGAMLYQLSYQAIWELVTLWVRNIPVEGEECKWICERSYIWTTEKDMNIRLFIVVIQLRWSIIYSYLSPQLKIYDLSYTHLLCPLRWLWFHSCLEVLYNCDDHLCLQIFCRSSNIWSFIYLFAFFTIYGYITDSKYDQLPVGLTAQLVEQCNGIADVMGSNPRSGPSFFQALISELPTLCIWLRWSSLRSNLSPQFKCMIFHIFTCNLRYVARHCVTFIAMAPFSCLKTKFLGCQKYM